MDDNSTQEPAPTADDALRQRLLGRIAVAAVIIVGLLGSLAMFDSLYTPRPAHPSKPAVKEAPPPVAATEPPPAAAPGAEPNVDLPVAGEPPKPADGTATATAPGSTTPPAATPGQTAPGQATPGQAAPGALAGAPTTPPPPPEVSASPNSPPLAALPQERPLTKPATPKPAVIRPSEPAPLPPITRPDPRREIARGTTPVAPSGHAPASRPVTQALERQAERGFALQLGVFSNIGNAEDLRAKLEQAGIPASVEARVRAGPFANRAEVDSAREKLKALGISESIMVSVKR